MPDPRHPQRPSQRQPATQPHRGLPQERPVPHDPNADKVPGIHVGDPQAAARGGLSRPVRSIDPSQQPPAIEVQRKIRKGETYWIMGSEELPVPRKGKIIRLSNESGKAVGVEFTEPVGGIDADGQPWGTVHTCDGRGRNGCCLYVRPDQVLDEKSMQTHKARVAELQVELPKFDEYEELTVGPQDSQPLTPAMVMPEEGEKTTIGPNDVGKLDVKSLGLTKGKDEDEDEDDEGEDK